VVGDVLEVMILGIYRVILMNGREKLLEIILVGELRAEM